MTQFIELTKRHMRLYLRDRTAVFFSFLTMIIILVLMLVFLGDMSISGITEAMQSFGNRDIEKDKANVELLILAWTISGVIAVNCITVSMTAISTMVNDRCEHKLQSFLVTPVSRNTIVFSYLASAWITTVIMGILTFILGEVYYTICGGEWLDITAHIKVIGMILLNAFSYSAIMFTLGMIVKSPKAWSSFGTVISTLAGFLGAIYIPLGSLPESVGNVLKCLPFIHSASMFRQVLTADITETSFEGFPAEFTDNINATLGTIVDFDEKAINIPTQLAFILICGIIFISVSVAMIGKKADSDRSE